MDYLMGAAAFVVGAVLSYINYRIAKVLMPQNKLAAASLIRQVLSIGYLVGLYFIGQATDINLWALMIGGALGITLPLLVFTVLLVKKPSKPASGKEESDG